MQRLTMDEAVTHCEAGLGIWEWASNDQSSEPDVVWPAAVACRRLIPWRSSTSFESLSLMIAFT